MPEATTQTTKTAKKSKGKSRFGIERRRLRNRMIKEALKTRIKSAEKVAAQGQSELLAEKVRAAISALDKAAEKGVIHKNAAARRKSRLLKKVARVIKAPVVLTQKK